MEVTTVKLRKRTKFALDAIRTERETYDEIITKLLMDMKRKRLKKELEEAYRSMRARDVALLEEWDAATAPIEDDD